MTTVSYVVGKGTVKYNRGRAIRRLMCILRFLRDDGRKSAKEVGVKMGLHYRTVYRDLALLLSSGWVVRERDKWIYKS